MITVKYRENFDYYSVLFFLFQSSLHEESFTLYILLWIIFIFHLLIIRTFTWVTVPSDIIFGFLWVVVAKVVLFRGLLHINAAKKVATIHLMRWWQLSLWYFWVSFLLVCSWSISLLLEFSGGLGWQMEYILWTIFIIFEEDFLLRLPPTCSPCLKL